MLGPPATATTADEPVIAQAPLGHALQPPNKDAEWMFLPVEWTSEEAT